MTLLKYIILSIIQGFTEPLPISSSGHLKIFKYLFNSDVLNDMNFEIIVNLGSLIAIIILYKKQILYIIKDFFMYIKTKDSKYKINFRYSFLIVIGCIPAGIFGILIKDLIEQFFSIKIVGLMFIITSLLLLSIKDKVGNKNKEDIKIIDAIKIGLFQLLALLPGISRSGATIVGAMKSNLTRQAALNYSFMMYIPISIGCAILGIKDLLNYSNLDRILIPYIISLIISSITTYYSAKLFINIFNKGKIIYFSIYCFLIGILTLIFLN